MKKVEVDHFKHYRQPRTLHVDDEGSIFYILRSVLIEEDRYLDSLHRIPINEDEETDCEYQLREGFTCLNWLNSYELLVKDEKGSCFSYNPKEDKYVELVSINSFDIQKLSRIGQDRYLILGREVASVNRKYLIADEYPFQSDGASCFNKIRTSLYLYEEGLLRRLTSEKLEVAGFDVFKKEYAVFQGCEYDAVKPTTAGVYKIELEHLKITQIENSNQYIYSSISVIDQHRILLIRHDRSKYGEYQDEYLDELNLSTGKIRRLNGDSLFHLYDDIHTDAAPGIPFTIDFTVVGDEIYFTSTIRSSCHLMAGSFETGEIRQITKMPGKVMELIVLKDRVFMIAMRDYGGSEIYELNLKDYSERQRSNLNSFMEDYHFFVPEHLFYTNSDEMDIDGWVMKPDGLKEGEATPAILYIHGGPNTAYGMAYSHEMQYFCEQGYGVLYCNPRGSAGRRPEFADLRGKYGSVDYLDLMEFVEAAITKYPWIDRDRLGVTGGSYGGYMTNWIIGHTDIFQAAVSNRSTANNLSDFFTSEIGFSFTQDTYGSTPWGCLEFLWNSSPIKYAPNIKTPTLFIQGGEDCICTRDQAVQMYAALKYFGIPSRLVIAEGEDHSFTMEGTPSVRIKRLEEMKEWFDQYLKQNGAAT